ncbi:LmeA family phospholipid-binding protein [Marisediminicola sp. LYQ134]|uniref:LmeA family phospholipid-binding protein n=1 Tax=Marisediminicola sp. LYQ134 TaxID=3391061 RepID=UPI0039835DD0
MGEFDASPAASAPPRRRRRRRGLIALLVVVVVLVAAVIAADVVARSLIASQIESSVRSSLEVDESVAIDADVEGFSALQQLAVGDLERVVVTTDRVDLGGLVGSARIVAEGVPIDTSQPVDTVDAVITTDEAAVAALTATLTTLPVDSVEIGDGEILVSATIDVFGLEIPLGLGLVPGASDGAIDFTPTTVSVNGGVVGLAEVGQLFGAAADGLTETRSFCIAASLPESVVLDDVTVGDGVVDLALTADGVVLTEDALATTGTCPE